MNGLQEFTNNFNEVYNTCKSVFSFISNCFTKEGFLIGNLKAIAPGCLLVFVAILIILRILGFENSNKWIGLAFVLALIIAAL